MDTKAVVLWNSYLSNGDFFGKVKQIFSILGFLCIENFSSKGEEILDKFVAILTKFSTVPFRIARFCSVIASISLLKSLSTNIEEVESRLQSIKKKRKSGNTAVEYKIKEDIRDSLQEKICILLKQILFEKSSDVCPSIREETFAAFTSYLEKRGGTLIQDIQSEEGSALSDIVLEAISDEDKAAKLKGIELTEIYCTQKFGSTKVTQPETFFDNVLNLSLSNAISNDTQISLSMVKIIKLLVNYYTPTTEGKNLKIIKEFIFHPNPQISKEFIQIY
jgi:hypothetical protein